VPSQPLVRSRLVFCVVPPDGTSTQVVVNMEESLAVTESALDRVVVYNEFMQHPVDLLADVLVETVGASANIGIELDHISQASFSRLTSRLPNLKIRDARGFFAEARTVKLAEEIDALRRVGRAAHTVHYEALEQTRAGDSELDIAARIVSGLFARGVDDVLRLVVGSGERSWHANAAPTQRRLQEGDMIRLDIFGSLNGYLSDVARTGVVGEPEVDQVEVWNRFLALRRTALGMIRPGASTRSIYNAYAKEMEVFGYEPINFLGHGIGLTLHEEPYIDRYSDTELQAGMVLAIEPYLMLPEKNWGFQLEDEVVVTEDGYELITDVRDDAELIRVGGS
jgi:Xaa-Pro dipeptidase